MYQSPIYWAITSGQVDILKFLISRGADLNFLDGLRQTPLRWAEKNEEYEMVELIMQAMERAVGSSA